MYFVKDDIKGPIWWRSITVEKYFVDLSNILLAWSGFGCGIPLIICISSVRNECDYISYLPEMGFLNII
jgi:hypothetical protein